MGDVPLVESCPCQKRKRPEPSLHHTRTQGEGGTCQPASRLSARAANTWPSNVQHPDCYQRLSRELPRLWGSVRAAEQIQMRAEQRLLGGGPGHMQGRLQTRGQTERLLHPLVSVITSYHPVPGSLQHLGQGRRPQVV